MQTVAKVIVAILMVLFVAGVWSLIQKVTRLLLGQSEGAPKEQLRGIGIGIGCCAVLLGLALGIAWLAGVLYEPW
jgi:hypothetical protein